MSVHIFIYFVLFLKNFFPSELLGIKIFYRATIYAVNGNKKIINVKVNVSLTRMKTKTRKCQNTRT